MPKTRQAILAATLLHPQRWWYLSDLAHFLNVTPSSLQREMTSLVEAGILLRRREGNRVYFQSDPACPLLPELRGLLIKTIGLVDVLAEILQSFSADIGMAFVYGSLARGEETSASEIDLLVIGTLGLVQLAPALREAEHRLQRPINPTLFTWPEFVRKAREGNHFVRTILAAEKIYLKGNDNELDAAIGRQESEDAYNQQERVR